MTNSCVICNLGNKCFIVRIDELEHNVKQFWNKFMTIMVLIQFICIINECAGIIIAYLMANILMHVVSNIGLFLCMLQSFLANQHLNNRAIFLSNRLLVFKLLYVTTKF